MVEARRQAVSSTVGMLDFTTDEGPTNHIVLAKSHCQARAHVRSRRLRLMKLWDREIQ